MKVFATTLAALLLSAPIYAQDKPRRGDFYIEGSVLHYFTPEALSELIAPETGFRFGLGYELKKFRFTVESGYTKIEGTNPLVTNITFIPLIFKAGYALPLFLGFGVQADLGAGFLYSQTSRYDSAISLYQGNILHDKERSFASAARLYATFSPFDLIKFYAGGGLDVVLENAGFIPLPLVEAGVSIKPFAFSGSSNRRTAAVHGICFEANSAVLRDRSPLDEAGERLKASPGLQITLRAYYAPARTAQWQVRHSDGTPALSAVRAQWCADYLMQNYGVDRERITIEYRGAGRRIELYSCVEIIITGNR
jgi:hypothetical protein